MSGRVIIHCPKCGCAINFPSDSGYAARFCYHLYNVPAQVAGTLHGKTACCPSCAAQVCVRVTAIVQAEIVYVEPADGTAGREETKETDS